MKYNIEFFHIYGDDDITSEHTLSLQIKDKLQAAIAAANDQDSSLSLVMVDDYNAPLTKVTRDLVKNVIETAGSSVNQVVYESEFYETGINLLNFVKPRIFKEYSKLIKKKQKLPCSLFIATFYLSRLGALENPVINETNLAEKTITVIDKRYTFVELKALKLIANSQFSSKLDNIYHYLYTDKEGLSDDRINSFVRSLQQPSASTSNISSGSQQ